MQRQRILRVPPDHYFEAGNHDCGNADRESFTLREEENTAWLKDCELIQPGTWDLTVYRTAYGACAAKSEIVAHYTVPKSTWEYH